jgi:hypothetical protein
MYLLLRSLPQLCSHRLDMLVLSKLLLGVKIPFPFFHCSFVTCGKKHNWLSVEVPPRCEKGGGLPQKLRGLEVPFQEHYDLY